MAAHRGPCLPPLSCHPGVELTAPGVAPGLHFPPTGLVLGPLRRLHHQHQLEMASKILHVKMSGKADSSSTQFLICHLQSHMYQQPKVTPVNWQETRAAVAPTEENGVPHHFLPSQGDLCRSSPPRPKSCFCCCYMRIVHTLPPIFLPLSPSH